MGPKMLIFSARRPDITLEQYKDHYENVHVPLLRTIMGEAFPVTHERQYILRSSNGSAQLLGGSGDLDFDCVAISTFVDEEHLKRAAETVNAKDTKEIREKDEAKFLDMSKTKIIMVESRVESCLPEKKAAA